MKTHALLNALAPLLMAAGLVSAGCEDDLGEPRSGRRVSGTVTFDGEVPEDNQDPGLFIAAVSAFPLLGAPHAVLIIRDPDFTRGIEYELSDVPPHDYFLIARLRDFSIALDPAEAFGAYPNFCVLQDEPRGNVTITDEAPVEGIDIQLYADGGLADPCTLGDADVCPAAGAATLVAAIAGDFEPAREDVLIFALFTSWPREGLPARPRVVPGNQIELPETLVDNGVPPGEYAILVCYDIGGDDILDGLGCGDEDLEIVFRDGELVPLAEGTITRLRFDLLAGTAEDAVIQDPADLGCGLP